MIKKRVDLRSSDIIQNSPHEQTLWLDLYAEFFIRKRKRECLVPCVEGMVAFNGDLAMAEKAVDADPTTWQGDIDQARADLKWIEQEGFSIRLGTHTWEDYIVIGEDYVTQKNLEPILLVYMKRRGYEYNEVKFVWHRTNFVIWPA